MLQLTLVLAVIRGLPMTNLQAFEAVSAEASAHTGFSWAGLNQRVAGSRTALSQQRVEPSATRALEVKDLAAALRVSLVSPKKLEALRDDPGGEVMFGKARDLPTIGPVWQVTFPSPLSGGYAAWVDGSTRRVVLVVQLVEG